MLKLFSGTELLKMSPHDRDVTSVSVQNHTQLLFSVRKYKTRHVLRQQTWTALIDEPTGDVQRLSATLHTFAFSLHRVSRSQSVPTRRWGQTLLPALPRSCRHNMQ